MLDGIKRVGPLQSRQPGPGVQRKRQAAGTRRRASVALKQGCRRFVEGIGAGCVAEYIPNHNPPAARTKQASYLGQRLVLVEPVEGCGADAKVKAGLAQLRIFERQGNHCERLIPHGPAKEFRRALIGLDGNQGVGAKRKQTAGRRPCPGANLEGSCALRKPAMVT